MMRNFTVAGLILTIACSSAFAGNSSKAHSIPKVSDDVLKTWTGETVTLSDGEFNTLKKAAQARAKGRHVANSPVAGEDLMSPEFKTFRDTFLKVTTPEEIDALLNKLDREYDSYPTDLKFAAAQLVPLRVFRSMVYRMIPMVEEQKITHSMLLTYVKTVAAGVRVFFPTDQWTAGFRYVTEPMNVSDSQFPKVSDFQHYLGSAVIPELRKSISRLKALNLNSKTIVADNQLLYGTASFQDDLDRYRLVGQAELNADLAGLHAAVASISMFNAYNVNALFSVAQDMGYLYGVDGFNWSGPEGAPASKRAAVIRKYSDFLTLEANGTQWTQLAFRHIKASAQYTSLAWAELKTRPLSESWAIDPRFFTPNTRINDLSIQNAEATLQGQTELRSAVTGEVVTVNLPAFYSNPPKDLKAMLPTDFESGTEKTKMLSDNAGSVKVTYRNYFEGHPTNWDVSAYRTYFPSIGSGADVPKTARILAESWGGGLAGVPLAMMGL